MSAHKCRNCKVLDVTPWLCIECWRIAIIGAVAVALVDGVRIWLMK